MDGDGLVGNRDYVIAKLFDKDKDGKLNAQERKAAMEALSNVNSSSLIIDYCRGLKKSSCGVLSRAVPSAPTA